MRRAARRQSGFSLIELATVVTVIGILAAVAIPLMDPSIADQLELTAQVVSEDLSYARSLAVVNNSKYRITVDFTNQQYYLEHSGTNTALNTLPSSANRMANDVATRQTTRMSNIAASGGKVRLYAVQTTSLVSTGTPQIEFQSFGQTTQAAQTTVWLSAGSGTLSRYLPVKINPVTGLVTVGDLTSVAPSSNIAAGS